MESFTSLKEEMLTVLYGLLRKIRPERTLSKSSTRPAIHSHKNNTTSLQETIIDSISPEN